MDKIEKKGTYWEKKKLLQNMKKLNIIEEISKISKRSSFYEDGQDSGDHVDHNNEENLASRHGDRSCYAKKSPRREKNRQTNIFKKQNEELKQIIMENEGEIFFLKEENKILKQKLQKYECAIKVVFSIMEPYKNNLTIMESQLKRIKEAMDEVVIQNQQGDKCVGVEKQENSKTRQFNDFDTMQKTYKHEQEKYEHKYYVLNKKYNQILKRQKDLKKQVSEKNRQMGILSAIISEGEYVKKNRQLFWMSQEELLIYKLKYEKEKQNVQHHRKNIQRLRNKIMMLTSLIGYGVVSPIKSNDLYQIEVFKQNFQKKGSEAHLKISNDVYGLTQLANNSQYKDFILKSIPQRDSPYKNIYLPNFLVFYDHILFTDRQPESDTYTVIKPELFLTLRAIFDSKYDQFMCKGKKADRFAEFCYSFIQKFQVKKLEKKIGLEKKSQIQQEDKDLIKISFLLRIFDDKITNLPEIKSFRQFILNNACEDEIFYFLMCRNLLNYGPELNKYISCMDSYNFLSYEYVRHCLTFILDNYDKATKDLIMSNIYTKKISKKGKMLIKPGYVLRLLLEVYRKEKMARIHKLHILFDNVIQISKKPIIKFSYFQDILSKNFRSLSGCEIGAFYRKTVSIYQTSTSLSFFHAFYAGCSQELFLGLNLEQDIILKKNIFGRGKSSPTQNYMMELMPESVTQMGMESMHREYGKYLSLKELQKVDKGRICQFLLGVAESKQYKYMRQQYKEKYEGIIDQFNNILIDWINQYVQGQKAQEKKLQEASSKIGKQAKIKIYQFYQDFISDIKKELDQQTK